jgi:hypothetical protein
MVQPFPQVVNGVVGLVRMTGEHLDHFLARCTPYVIPQACAGRSPMQEANVPRVLTNVRFRLASAEDGKLTGHLQIAEPRRDRARSMDTAVGTALTRRPGIVVRPSSTLIR